MGTLNRRQRRAIAKSGITEEDFHRIMENVESSAKKRNIERALDLITYKIDHGEDCTSDLLRLAEM